VSARPIPSPSKQEAAYFLRLIANKQTDAMDRQRLRVIAECIEVEDRHFVKSRAHDPDTQGRIEAAATLVDMMLEAPPERLAHTGMLLPLTRAVQESRERKGRKGDKVLLSEAIAAALTVVNIAPSTPEEEEGYARHVVEARKRLWRRLRAGK
jgi:hypothetical protein